MKSQHTQYSSLLTSIFTNLLNPNHLFFVCEYRNGCLVLKAHTNSLAFLLFHSLSSLPSSFLSLSPLISYPFLSSLQPPCPHEPIDRVNSRRKLPKLVPHHLLRYSYIMIYLPIVHLELEPDKVGQDRRASRLGFNGRSPLAWFGADDGETVRCRLVDQGQSI